MSIFISLDRSKAARDGTQLVCSFKLLVFPFYKWARRLSVVGRQVRLVGSFSSKHNMLEQGLQEHVKRDELEQLLGFCGRGKFCWSFGWLWPTSLTRTFGLKPTIRHHCLGFDSPGLRCDPSSAYYQRLGWEAGIEQLCCAAFTNSEFAVAENI